MMKSPSSSEIFQAVEKAAQAEKERGVMASQLRAARNDKMQVR